jgi:hypothetical protein
MKAFDSYHAQMDTFCASARMVGVVVVDLAVLFDDEQAAASNTHETTQARDRPKVNIGSVWQVTRPFTLRGRDGPRAAEAD